MRSGRRRAVVAALAMTMALAACGQASTPSPSPTAVAATPVATPTPSPTPSPTPEPTPEPTSSTVAALADAAQATVDQGTVSVDMAITFDGSSAIPDGTSITGDGTMAFGDERRMAMAMDMRDLGQGTLAMIVDGEVVWVRFAGPIGKQLRANNDWIKIDEEAQGALAAALRGSISGPNDSSLLLYYLLGATDDAVVAGPEMVNGIPATRIDATLDFEAALELVPPEVRDALVINIDQIRTQAVEPVVASRTWVGDDGLVHRMELVYELSAAQGFGTMTFEVDYRDHGAPLDLGIPDDRDVTPIDELKLPGG